MLNNIRNIKQFKTYRELTSYIREIPIERVAESLGLQLQKTGSSLQSNCPTGHPSKSGKCFSVNTIGNYFRCWSCGIGGSTIDLVMDTKDYSFGKTLEWFTTEFEISHSVNLNTAKETTLSEEEKQELDLSISKGIYYELVFDYCHKLLFEDEGKEALDYLVNERKYDIEKLKNSDFCYFPDGKKIIKYMKEQFPDVRGFPLYGAAGDYLKVGIPYRDMNGKITGFLKRSTSPKGITINDRKDVRWDSTKGLKKTDLFNLHKYKKEETLIIVEGYPDALYLSLPGKDNIVAIGQGLLSKSHFIGLNDTKVKNVIISFDNDDVGPKNTIAALELIYSECKIAPFVLEPKLMSPHKDPDEYVRANGMEAFQKLLKKSEKGLLWWAKKIISELDSEDQLSRKVALTKLVGFFSLSNDSLEEAELNNIIVAGVGIEKAVLNKMIKSYKEQMKIEAYKKIIHSKIDGRYLPFIEKGTSSYAYYDSEEDEVYLGVAEKILGDILASAEQKLPDIFPLLKADFEVMMNERFDLEKQKFNFFVPTKYLLLEKNDKVITPSEYFPNIEKLLINLLPKTEERLRFFNWLAGILQTRQKQQTAWVFKGTPGAGKGVMLDHVLKPLLGEKQAIKVEDQQLVSDFNPWLQNALLIAFNEVAHDNKTRNSVKSKVKAIITDSEVIINEKNIRNYSITNHVNCLFFSNEEVPVFIEQGDRRFNVVMTRGNLRDNDWFKDPDGFFKKLAEEIPHLAQFLMNWNYDKIAAMTCINNDDKELMVGAAMNKFEEFAYHLKAADIPWFEENLTVSVKKTNFNSNDLLNRKIRKNDALSIFEVIYSSFSTASVDLAKKLKLYGIKSFRDRTGGKAKYYYTWNSSLPIGRVSGIDENEESNTKMNNIV